MTSNVRDQKESWTKLHVLTFHEIPIAVVFVSSLLFRNFYQKLNKGLTFDAWSLDCIVFE